MQPWALALVFYKTGSEKNFDLVKSSWLLTCYLIFFDQRRRLVSLVRDNLNS